MSSLRHTATAEPAEERYLDAAAAAILAVGWSRTTLTDVARRAGVSRMTLYRRWPDTDTLLADLMTREWTRIVVAASTDDGETFGEADGDGLERLVVQATRVVAALRADPLLRRVVDVDPTTLLPYLLQRRGRTQDLLADLLATRIREGQRDGSVRAGDPVLLARALLLAAHGFLLSAHTMTDATHGLADYDAELAQVVRSYLAPTTR